MMLQGVIVNCVASTNLSAMLKTGCFGDTVFGIKEHRLKDHLVIMQLL